MKTYIIHVKEAVERERHIRKQLEGKNLDTEFILEGDKAELNEQILQQYFSGEMRMVQSATSCAFKHIMAYEKQVRSAIPYSLILEDDIVLYPNFNQILDICLAEIQRNKLSNILVSLEDSSLTFVKGSEIKKDQHLYLKKSGRMAGAYLIDLSGAQSILDRIAKHKCSLPIDWFHNECADNNLLNIYWCKPALACQGSLNGDLKSLIDDKSFGLIKQLSFKVQRLYKQMLYSLR